MCSLQAQDTTYIKYGLPVLSSRQAFEEKIAADSAQRMVELHTLMPGIKYELHYATTDNFMHRRMYPADTRHTFLRLPAARALAQVRQALLAQGYDLKIFDAYRPYAVTVHFWELVHDERYVANPASGSGHNRGLAVDLTLIDQKSGQELEMGTGFDNFTDTAHQSFTGLPEKVLANRALLRETMEQYGFRPLSTEWWHYSWPNDRNYDVLDLNFQTLLQLSK